MAVGDCVQFSMIGMGPTGEQLVNVLHYVQTSGVAVIDPAAINTMCDNLATEFLTAAIPLITPDYSYRETKGVGVTAAIRGIAGQDFSDVGVPGMAVPPSGGIERSMCFIKRAFIGGRKGIGRCFLPLPPRAVADVGGVYTVGVPLSPAVVAFETFLTSVQELLPSVNFSPCIYHRTTDTQTIIIGASLGNVIGIQRRRRFGIGV